MKKITKTLIALGCVATLSAGVCAMAACNEQTNNPPPASTPKTGAAYALSHNANYVAYASITLKDNAITDVTLTEVDLPDQVKFSGTAKATSEEAIADLPATPEGMTQDDFAVVVASSTKDDVTTYTATAYYKTVSYGSVTMTYDTDAKTYKVGDKAIREYYKTEANCKAYYEAVIGNKINVKAGATTKADLLTKATLSKEENGYWTKKDNDGNDYSRWKWNRDATVKYVKENGVDKISTLTKPGKEDPANGKDLLDADVRMWVDGNNVSTGATWSDLYYAGTAPTAYLTYGQILINAYNAAK